METCSTTSVLNSVLAGYAAGVSGTLVGHPFDSLKVWMQTRDHQPPPQQQTPSANGRPPPSSPSSSFPRLSSANLPAPGQGHSHSIGSRLFSGVGSAVAVDADSASMTDSWKRSLLRRMRALYAGVSGPLVTVGFVQSVNFAIYDSCRRMLYRLQERPEGGLSGGSPSGRVDNNMEYLHNDSMANVCLASVVAGSVLAVFTSPMLIVKTKQQTQGLTFRQALGETVFAATSQQRHAGGKLMSPSLRTMYVGFPIHLLSETLGRCVYYATYESLKRYIVRLREQDRGGIRQQPSGITVQERMACAAASGILCWSVIFPIDAVRSRMFAQPSTSFSAGNGGGGGGATNKSVGEMARYMYAHQGGARAFFRGYGVTVLRAGPVAAAVLPIYDMTLEYLSSSSSSL